MSKILVLAFLVLFFFVIGIITFALVALPFLDLNLETLNHMLESPSTSNIGIMKIFQMAQSVLLFLIPAIIAAWLFSHKTSSYLMADIKPDFATVILVIMSFLSAIPLMNSITLWNAGMNLPDWMSGIERWIRQSEDSAVGLTEMFLQGGTYRDLIVNFIMIAILPALGEEFLFRGVLQKLFIDLTKNHHAGIFMAAFVFSFIHFQFYGFIPRLLLGLYFGYLMVWSSSIWVPVIAHLVNNGIAVIYYHFSDSSIGQTPLDTFGTEEKGHYFIYISTLLTAIIIAIIYMNEKRGRKQRVL